MCEIVEVFTIVCNWVTKCPTKRDCVSGYWQEVSSMFVCAALENYIRLSEISPSFDMLWIWGEHQIKQLPPPPPYIFMKEMLTTFHKDKKCIMTAQSIPTNNKTIIHEYFVNITCKSKRWGSMRCWRVSLKTTTFCLMKLFIADSSLCPGRLFSRLDWICLWSPAREVYQLSYNCSWELRRLSTDKWWEIQVMMLTFLIFRPYLVVWGTKTRPNSWPTEMASGSIFESCFLNFQWWTSPASLKGWIQESM